MVMISQHRSIIIVLPNAFQLGWMGSSSHLFNLANSLRVLDFDVVLLAGKYTNSSSQSNLDDYFPGPVIRTRHTGDYPRLFDTTNLTRRCWRALWKFKKVIGDDNYLSNLSWGWSKRLNINIIQHELRKRRINPVFVWGISGGYLAGPVAALSISKLFTIPFVLELHDPPYGAELGVYDAKVTSKFKECLDNSKAIVVNTNNYRKLLIRKYDLASRKIHTIHLAFQESAQARFTEPSRGEYFNIFYAGSLGGSRSILPVIQGLSHAFNKEPKMRDQVKFKLVGAGPGFKEALSRAAKLSMDKSVVQYLGYLESNSIRVLLKDANILILVQTVESAFYEIPGKIFDNLASKRPILGVMPPDCEAAGILRDSGLGIVHAESDLTGIGSSLIKLWDQWRTGQQTVIPNEEYISSYSTKNLPKKHKIVLESIGNIL